MIYRSNNNPGTMLEIYKQKKEYLNSLISKGVLTQMEISEKEMELSECWTEYLFAVEDLYGEDY